MSNIANLKLESFFNNHKLVKKSSLGHFGDVITEEDLKSVAEMVFKMVTLPKYEKIKSQLRSANGIVNFVTYEEFEPLVEAIFRTALPPDANDIYHMGQGFTMPEDYFVNARSAFGPQGSASGMTLERVFQGTNKKVSKEWLKENGLDPDSPMSSASFDMVFGEAGEEFKQILNEYEDAMAKIQRSSLRAEIDVLFRKIERDRQNKGLIPEIEKFNAGKPEAIRKPLPRVYSKEELDKIKKELRTKRTLYVKTIDSINNSGRFSVLDISNLAPDMFSNSGEKNNDGFMSWSPEQEINTICSDILGSQGEVQDAELVIKVENLIQRLMNYRTSDPDLIEKRKKIIEFLGVKVEGNKYVLKDSNLTIQKFGLNTGTFTRLVNEFLGRASQHGKVMILTDVDNSALTSPPQSSSLTSSAKGSSLTNLQVFQDFVATNNANMVRDMQSGKKSSRGKRTVILVSSLPLANLPKGASTIEMDISPVDEKEAEIIVNSLIDAYVGESEKSMKLKMSYDIEKKYEGKDNQIDWDKKLIETDQIDEVIASARTRLAYISPDGRRKISQMLIGVGQKPAIQKCREFLATHVFYEKDEDGVLSTITFDEKTLLVDMVEEFTKLKTDNVPGLQLRESKVKFNHYITKKGSKWGLVVGDIAFKAAQTEGLNKEMKSVQEEISQIDFELRDSRLSTATKKAKLESRKGWNNLLNKLIIERDGLTKDIPHYCILRGLPGVGKSVWGDALADLLGCLLYAINIGEVFDKWLGNTEKNNKALLNAVFQSRNAVFMIDEVDRMLDMKGSNSNEGSAGGGHPTEKKVVKDFLDAFDLRIEELKERNVYVIMTTNHVNDIDEALFKRSKGNVWEVEMSDDPDDYLKFLETFMEKERKTAPTDPWIRSGGSTFPEMWDYTINYVKSNINLRELAMDFAQKKLSFRSLSGMIEKACRKHNTFVNEFLPAISRGEPVTPKGLPLTTANLRKAITFINDVNEGNLVDIEMDGIDDVYKAMHEQVEKAWGSAKMEEITINHPVTGKPRKGYKLPADILGILEGNWSSAEENAPQFDVSEEEVSHPSDPNIKQKQVLLQPSKPRKDIGELADSGMKEEPFGQVTRPPVGQEKIPSPNPNVKENVKEKEMEGKSASTSEYLYRFLKAKGVITPEGKVVVKEAQAENGQQAAPVIQPFDSLEQHGTYYFNNGQVVIMAEGANVPPIRFYNSKKSGN